MFRLMVESVGRIGAIRANASKKSHAELEECEELDRGNLSELGEDNAALIQILPNLPIFGGCCGTDHCHIEEICHTSMRRRNDHIRVE
jgi:homocysteine S-methyltransferase